MYIKCMIHTHTHTHARARARARAYARMYIKKVADIEIFVV